MRLGIEDSSRIAQVLNYSLNTIYAYRNRMKARAVDRETFEKDIMNIGDDWLTAYISHTLIYIKSTDNKLFKIYIHLYLLISTLYSANNSMFRA